MSSPVEYRVLRTRAYKDAEASLAEQVAFATLPAHGRSSSILARVIAGWSPEINVYSAYRDGKWMIFSAEKIGTTLRARRNDLFDHLYPDAAALFSEVARGEANIVEGRYEGSDDWQRLKPGFKEQVPQGPSAHKNGQQEPNRDGDPSHPGASADELGEPVAEMRAVMGSIDQPGKGEAAHHLRRHAGLPPEAVQRAIEKLFYGGDRVLDSRLVNRAVSNGAAREAKGRPCRYCSPAA